MDDNRALSADQILERISTDRALHEAIKRLLEEVQGFRADINDLRREMTSPSVPRYLNTADVAEMFGVSTETVRRRVNNGVWPAWRDGRHMRFGPEEIATIAAWGRPKSPEPPLTPQEKRRRNRDLRGLLGNYFED